MPIYEYRCQSCGAEFEEWQKITDPAVAQCSACGGNASRLISRSTFILKGTGWYVTDYARKGCSASSDSSTTTTTSTKESKSKSESKSSDSASSSD